MDVYSFFEGPMLWFAFLIFILGSLLRIIATVVHAGKADRAMARYFSLKYVLATLGRWLLPLNRDVIKSPVFTLAGYAFHICLILVPVWLGGHVTLWEESRLGWSWLAIPDALADVLTVLFLIIALFFLLRRIFSPYLRPLTSISDYLMLIVTGLPFLTGYFLMHGTLDGMGFIGVHIRLIHVLSAELMLVLIPFTKLSHFVLFFFSRSATAIEFGRRGYSV